MLVMRLCPLPYEKEVVTCSDIILVWHLGGLFLERGSYGSAGLRVAADLELDSEACRNKSKYLAIDFEPSNPRYFATSHSTTML